MPRDRNAPSSNVSAGPNSTHRATAGNRRGQSSSTESAAQMLAAIMGSSRFAARAFRRVASVEDALVEMYLAGVSVRRAEDTTEALWGTRVSSGTVSRLNQIYRQIEAWRTLRIEGQFAYLYLDGVVLKRSWVGEVRNISVLVAIGVGSDGFRQIFGVAEGQKEDLEGWRGFLRYLKDRVCPVSS